MAGALADCVAGLLISLAAGARASEAFTALAKGFVWGLVGFVVASVFVALVFTVMRRVRPQALAVVEHKEPKHKRRWWFTHGLIMASLVVFAFGTRHLGSAFFGGVILGMGVVSLPGMLFVTTFLYRRLIEPNGAA